MRSAIVVTSVLALILSSGCAEPEDQAASPSPPAEQTEEPAAPPPVTLAGQVNNQGSTDLGSAAELDLEIDNFYFEPTFIKAAPGTKLTVQLANEGSAPHTFTSDEPAVDEELQPGTNRAVELTLPAGGVVVFRCRFHVNQGMQGAIYFAEGDAAPTQTGTSTGTGGY